jgi:hypothetical protein
MTCETCHFYRAKEGDLGDCRRYPPQRQMGNYEQWVPMFVPTFRTNWCGEYKASERDAPQPTRDAKRRA